MTDSLNNSSHDSLIYFLLNDKEVTTKYILAQYYLQTAKFSDALSLLESIPYSFRLSNAQEFQNQKFIDFISLIQSVYNDTLGYIIPDSTQNLLNLAQNDVDLCGAWARNLLEEFGVIEYTEPIIMLQALRPSREKISHGNNVEISSDFNIYPNPCKDYFIAEYKKEKIQDDYLVKLVNGSGFQVSSFKLSRSSNQVIIPMEKNPSGIYYCCLISNGKIKGVKKIVKSN